MRAVCSENQKLKKKLEKYIFLFPFCSTMHFSETLKIGVINLNRVLFSKLPPFRIPR